MTTTGQHVLARVMEKVNNGSGGIENVCNFIKDYLTKWIFFFTSGWQRREYSHTYCNVCDNDKMESTVEYCIYHHQDIALNVD